MQGYDDLVFLSRAVRDLPPSAFSLLVVMRCFADGSRELWPSRRRLADELGWRHQGSVSRAAGVLVSRGFLERVSRGRWRILDSELETNRPPRNNAATTPAMKKLNTDFPVVAALVEQSMLRVVEESGEGWSANQAAVFRRQILAFLSATPAAVSALESAEWWDELVSQSKWKRNKVGGNLGFGRRMAWVFQNRMRDRIPTRTEEERRTDVDEALRSEGHNPFL